MSAGNIPTSAIITWMREIEGETDRSELARSVRMVRAIDEESMPLRREKKEDQDAK